jgi:hypothetical protein
LAELLAEHQKLGPFMQVLPICNKLLSQGEIFQFPPHCVLQLDGSSSVLTEQFIFNHELETSGPQCLEDCSVYMTLVDSFFFFL